LAGSEAALKTNQDPDLTVRNAEKHQQFNGILQALRSEGDRLPLGTFWGRGPKFRMRTRP
jgi:hypothetical protein